MLVVSIQGDFSQAKKEIDLSAKRGAQAIELRLDLMPTLTTSQIAALRDLSSLPIIFTLRKQSQGGSFKGSEEERKKKILALSCLNPDYIDIESDCNWMEEIPSQIKRIVSYHNFKATPDNLETILDKLKQVPAQIYKIATLAHSSIDALRLLLFAQKNPGIAAMCLGNFGMLTRILAPVVGSALTYACLEKKTAPGQMSLSELISLYRYPELNLQTTIYGVIGDPLDQSLGPLFHNQMFARLSKNGVYVKIPLKKEHLLSFFSIIKELPFAGLSVTMPLKEAILSRLNRIDPEAKKIGAVNTLIKQEGQWVGMNTDGKGALDALERKKSVANQTVLIIGSGGVSRAIAQEAANRGARVVVSSRTFGNAQKVAAQVGGKAILPHQIQECAYDILVNATPIGMGPNQEEKVLPETEIREMTLGLDVVIHPKKTPFLKAVERRGGASVFGVEMYVEQATAQLKAWAMIEEEKTLCLSNTFNQIFLEKSFEPIHW